MMHPRMKKNERMVVATKVLGRRYLSKAAIATHGIVTRPSAMRTRSSHEFGFEITVLLLSTCF